MRENKAQILAYAYGAGHHHNYLMGYKAITTKDGMWCTPWLPEEGPNGIVAIRYVMGMGYSDQITTEYATAEQVALDALRQEFGNVHGD